ncbi:MAG: hypothetical protein RL094_26 [Candidatus Parcubacteria bacterium]|jgi:hypothetical protein
MISWAAKRQLAYATLVLVVLLIVIGLPVYFIYIQKQPTCFDKIKNQNEQGVDCGGVCQRACMEQVIPLPITMWSRAFKVSGGTYNLAAYVQNANVDYTSEPTRYLFRVYDSENVLIGIREGITSVPPTKSFPIFEQAFNTGERVPAKVFFEFTRGMVWKKYAGVKPEIEVIDERFVGTTTASSSMPRLEAALSNKTVNTYRNIEVVTIVYDIDGNAMAASRTYVDILPGKQQVPILFTWPEPFKSEVSKVEVIPKLVF